MTQQWGAPGQQNQAGQQWTGQQATGQQGWNRPTQAWGAPTGQPVPAKGQQPYPQLQPGVQAQYPQGGYPQATGYRAPQAQFGQPAYGQPGSLLPGNRGSYSPGGPQRKSPLRGVLVGLVLVIGIGIFAISLLNYLGSGTDLKGADNRPTAGPTATVPAPTPSVPEPDYNPPAIPQPETYGEATQWLTESMVYSQSVAIPTDCAVPQIDITTASVTDLTSHLNDLTACLVRVWQGPLNAAGFQLPRPPVTVYTEPITTGCGSLDDVNAVYCAADQRIYYAKPLYKIFPKDQQRAPFVVEAVLAHEFGHTIQARTGIIVSSMAWEQKSSTAAAKVFSRRLETQADCLSGMFTAAVGQSSGLSADELANLREIMYNLGDDVLTGQAGFDGEHGLGKSRRNWFTKGQQGNAVSTCNTYKAPASQVR